MKLKQTNRIYASPIIRVKHLTVEGNFCQSGNLPNKLDESTLFEEDFNS